MIEIKIREGALIARIAAKRLGYTRIAIVVGRTIFLHNVSVKDFVSSKRWLLHELKHIDQYNRHGTINFIFSYIIDYFKNGYTNNIYEIEARAAENDMSLLRKYNLGKYLR